MNEQWKSNPALKGIDATKLQFITELASQTQNTKKEALLPLLLGMTNKANSKGINFTNNETDLLVNILSANMSSEELKQLENIKKMAAMLSKKHTK